jgi:hypothetical protein
LERSTTNQKHESKSATRVNHDGYQLNKATERTKNAALRAIGLWKVYNFFGFFGGAWYKGKTNYKTQDNTSWAS